MRMLRSLLPAAVTALAALAAPPPTTRLDLKLVSEGIRNAGGGYYPATAHLQDDPPSGIRKLPTGLGKAPRFATLRFGPFGHETVYWLLLDEEQGRPPKLYVDFNRNGDFTDDPAVEWKPVPYKGGTEEKPVDLTRHEGGAWIELPFLGKGTKVSLRLYRFDPEDKDRAAFNLALIYYLDCAWKGTITLGGQTYDAQLRDPSVCMDFTRPYLGAGRDLYLSMDLNRDGKFGGASEIREAHKPFNVGGTTYELRGWTPDGSKVTVVKSAQTAKEVPLEPKLLSSPVNGSPMVSIQGKALGGQAIDFPAAYKGKVVLLDFWATWCGPCKAEIPHMVAAYQALHAKGFEILGVSLDNAGMEAKIQEFVKGHGMAWPQLYDGKAFDNLPFQKLGGAGIPTTFLVDGDTGLILAQNNEIRGPQLLPAVEKALAAKAAR